MRSKPVQKNEGDNDAEPCWARLLMMVQATISLAVVALLAARAVTIP